jgi:transposase
MEASGDDPANPNAEVAPGSARICERYADLTLAQADFSAARALAIDETSRCSHQYVTLAADAKRRAVIFIMQLTTRRTARAWMYQEQLRDILDRKQIHAVSRVLRQWCINIMRSKVESIKEVARLIRNHFQRIAAWTRTRQTNGFLEALNGYSRRHNGRREVWEV